MDLKTFASTPNSFGRIGRAVTPSDADDLPEVVKAIVVTAAGDLAFLPADNADDEPVIFEAAPIGFVPPYMIRRVLSTGTTATVFTVE